MKMKRVFAVGVMLVAALVATSSSAQDVESIHKLAEQGDAEAQTILGAMYFSGVGIPEDGVEAVKWFRKAESLDGAF
jgi:TPR repeat protein